MPARIFWSRRRSLRWRRRRRPWTGRRRYAIFRLMCSLTLEADGSALYGGNAVEMMETLQHMGASAAGLNCSVGPDQLEAVVASMKEAAQIPVLVKPNAGLPVIDAQGAAHYSMEPEAFARSMKKLVERGAGIVGGCCGTEPEHIRRLAEVLGRF